MTCQLPVRMSASVVALPSPLEAPVMMTVFFLSPTACFSVSNTELKSKLGKPEAAATVRTAERVELRRLDSDTTRWALPAASEPRALSGAARATGEDVEGTARMRAAGARRVSAMGLLEAQPSA